MVDPTRDPVGIEVAEDLAALGYDYIDLSMRDVTALSAAGLDQLEARLQRAGLACEACNNFFPAEVRLTGPAADLPAALRFAEKAFAAAARLGVSVVVFGSSGARNVPVGFPADAAWAQLRTLLVALAPRAEVHGITVAIEHLNRGESNIINTVAEGWRMAREVEHPRVRLLIDAYHMLVENESPAILTEVASAIAHVHIAQKTERLFPANADAALTDFFRHLLATGYAGRCSVEAATRDFRADAARALRVCRALAGQLKVEKLKDES